MAIQELEGNGHGSLDDITKVTAGSLNAGKPVKLTWDDMEKPVELHAAIQLQLARLTQLESKL